MAGWTKIPNSLIHDCKLSPAEFRLLCCLHSYNWGNGDGERKDIVWPATGTLAELLGVKRQAISKLLRRLEAKGYITKIRSGRGRHRSNVYRLENATSGCIFLENATSEPQKCNFSYPKMQPQVAQIRLKKKTKEEDEMDAVPSENEEDEIQDEAEQIKEWMQESRLRLVRRWGVPDML